MSKRRHAPPVSDRRQRLTETPLRAAEAVTGRDTVDEGFRRLSVSGGLRHSIRDLQPIKQDRQNRLVYYLWESNPVAQWLIETTVDFILGEGWKAEHDEPEVQKVLDEFVKDPVNRLDLRMDSFAREFGLFGELALPVAVNPADGHVRLGVIDPLDIEEIQTDPNNILLAETVIMRGAQASDIGAPTSQRRALRVCRPETDRADTDYGTYRLAEPGETTQTGVAYNGDVMLWQTNKISTARRGRSDILALIDWLDGYDAYLFDVMDAGQHFNTYIWDVELQGMTEPQIREWLSKNGSVSRGQIRAHNEKVKWEEVTPDVKAQDKDTLTRMLRGHIIGSRSFPEHWMGLAGDVNLASAKEMGLPPVKRLTRRQRELRGIITDLCTLQLHMAVRAKVLKAEYDDVPVADGLRVVMPELSMRDQAGIVAAVTSLTTALQLASSTGWIRPETAARVFAHLLSQLGVPVDSRVEFDPNVPAGDAIAPYAQQTGARLTAQLGRVGNGNGDNIGQPKATTPKGGQVPA